jgi:predicted TIM-barrel fold metal-dependent hydrolase
MRLNGHREAAFTYQECVALMDEAGVDRALILPPSWEGDRTDYALEACEAHPDRFGVMARIPQNKPAEGAAMMRDFAQNPHIKGTRLTFHRPIDRNWMIDGTNDWYWPLAEELGLVTMVHAPIWKAELGAIGYWTAETADLYERPNIYVKVSAIPGYSTHPFPNLNIARYVREMVDKMGPERCFWGTDLTRLMEHGLTYTDTIEQFTKHFPLTEEELEYIMGRGICECLGWPIPVNA